MINNTTLMGRLTADPELKKTPNNVSVTVFTLAVQRAHTSSADTERKTDFITCVAWRGTAEFICKYFEKGQLLAVIGELHMNEWQDKEGNKRKNAEVRVLQASFCGRERTVEVAELPPRELDPTDAPEEEDYNLAEEWFPDEDSPF